MREPGELLLFRGHPSWRSSLGHYTRGVVMAVVVGALAGIASAILHRHVRQGWVGLGVLLAFAWMIGRGAIRQQATRYTLTSSRLLIEHGLLHRQVLEAPLHHVQGVYARQTMLERLLRVGTVEFEVAHDVNAQLEFRGVEQPRAIALEAQRAVAGHWAWAKG